MTPLAPPNLLSLHRRETAAHHDFNVFSHRLFLFPFLARFLLCNAGVGAAVVVVVVPPAALAALWEIKEWQEIDSWAFFFLSLISILSHAVRRTNYAFSPLLQPPHLLYSDHHIWKS